MQISKRPDPELLHTETFALRAWVLAAASVLARVVWRHLPRNWRIEARRYVGYAESELKLLVVRIALAHWTRHGFRRRATTRPSSMQPGFRQGRHFLSLQREFTRIVRLPSHGDACVARRIGAMQAVLRNLRRWIVRVHKRLATIKLGARLVAVRPVAMIVESRAAAPVTCADTS